MLRRSPALDLVAAAATVRANGGRAFSFRRVGVNAFRLRFLDAGHKMPSRVST